MTELEREAWRVWFRRHCRTLHASAWVPPPRPVGRSRSEKRATSPAQRKMYRCSECGELGHNARGHIKLLLKW